MPQYNKSAIKLICLQYIGQPSRELLIGKQDKKSFTMKKEKKIQRHERQCGS